LLVRGGKQRARRWSLRGAPQFVQASYKTHAVDQYEPLQLKFVSAQAWTVGENGKVKQ
jgi:hypothetical protein